MVVLIIELIKSSTQLTNETEAARQTKQVYILEQMTHIGHWVHKFDPVKLETA